MIDSDQISKHVIGAEHVTGGWRYFFAEDVSPVIVAISIAHEDGVIKIHYASGVEREVWLTGQRSHLFIPPLERKRSK